MGMDARLSNFMLPVTAALVLFAAYMVYFAMQDPRIDITTAKQLPAEQQAESKKATDSDSASSVADAAADQSVEPVASTPEQKVDSFGKQVAELSVEADVAIAEAGVNTDELNQRIAAMDEKLAIASGNGTVDPVTSPRVEKLKQRVEAIKTTL